jgi:hypothetical protein
LLGMPKKSMKLAVLRESWRPTSAGDRAESRRLLAFRLAFSCLLLSLAIGFVYLVFSPFYHPTTRLFFLTANPSKLIDSNPIPFFQEDAFRFLSADGQFQPAEDLQQFFQLESPPQFRTTMAQVAGQIQHPSDVAIFYVEALPYYQDGKYFLQCENLERDNPLQGLLSLEELLVRANSLGARTVLLLLDIGHGAPGSLTESSANELLPALEQLVRSMNFPSLWVMVSNSSGQRSQRSIELRGSAFCQAVSLALEGQADVNRDRQIDMAEFQRYVTNYTQTLVDRISGGLSTQTPQLLVSSDKQNQVARSTVISPVPAQNWKALLASAALAEAAVGADSGEQGPTATELAEQKTTETSQNWLTSYVSEKSSRIKERSIEELDDNINYLPTVIGKRVRSLIGLSGDNEDEPGASATASADPAKPSEVSSTSGVASSQVESSEQASQGTEDAGTPGSSGLANAPATALPDLSRLADERVDRHQLLQMAWQYCNYLEQPAGSKLRPLDLAPHAWRAFICNLHKLEKRERVGRVLDPEEQRINLTSEIVGSYQLAALGQARVGNFIKRVTAQMPQLDLPGLKVDSVASAEQIAAYGGPQLAESLALRIQRFDRSLAANDRKAFDSQLAEVPAELSNQYVEFFWARQLAGRGSISWPVLSKALQLVRLYERLSYDPFNSNREIQQELKVANRYRMQGTRQAMDQIGPQWSMVCLRQLELAEQGLRRVERQIDDLRHAWQLRNELLVDADALLAWRQISVERLGNRTVDEDVEKILDNLQQLCALFLSRETSSLAEFDRCYRQLLASKARIDGRWKADALQLLSGTVGSSAPDDWLLDSLLATVVVRDETRSRLLGLKLEKSLTVPLAVDLTSNMALTAAAGISDREQAKQPAFALRVASLADLQPNSAIAVADDAVADDAEVQDAAMQGAGRDRIRSMDLAQFYRGLPTRIQAIADQPRASPTVAGAEPGLEQRLVRLRQAELGLRLLNPNDAAVFDGKAVMTELCRLELLECMRTKLGTLSDSLADALPQEVAFIRGAYSRVTQVASALSGIDETSVLPMPRVAVQGPAAISLMSEPQVTTEITWTNLGTELGPLWLIVEFDEALFEVEGLSDIAFYNAAEIQPLLSQSLLNAERKQVALLTAASDEADQSALDDARQQLNLARERLVYPLRVTQDILSPSGKLAAGQSLSVAFRIRRIGSGPSQSKLIWRLVGQDQYLRHETMIQLPVSEQLQLLADGNSGGWSESVEGITLHPWPNRGSEFRLGLSDSGGVPRTVRVDLLALTARQPTELPNSFLPAEASREVARQLGDFQTLVSLPELQLDPGQSVVWLPLADAASVTAGAGQAETAALEADSGVVAVESTSKAAELRSIRSGLVAKITDQASQQVLWRRIDFRVRHPSSYIEILAGYDAIAERMEFSVRHSQADQLPATGIPIRARIVEGLPRGTEMRMEGALVDDKPLLLYCQVPASAPRELHVEVDVDSFPRAFVFAVPCWRTTSRLPVFSQSHKIEIWQPASGSSIKPDIASQLVKLRIDTARGAFESKQDAVEIGWDLDRDREFADEATVRVAADRQVDILLASLSGGRMALRSEVTDLVVNLPAPAVSNTRVNLLARVTALGETVWSAPVEIIVDGGPPVITGVELLPGAAFSQEADLTVRVGADDANLSGVQRVELAVNGNGSGKFEDSGEPILAERQADGSWLALLPGKPLPPGRAVLLVRAVDLVGNTSEVTKLPVEIFSAEGWSSRQAQSVQELSGSILFGDSELVDAKLTLKNAEGEVVYQATSDDRGAFRFPAVKTGTYTLTALGNAKNRPRKAEQVVELLAPPAAPTRVRLLAK